MAVRDVPKSDLAKIITTVISVCVFVGTLVTLGHRALKTEEVVFEEHSPALFEQRKFNGAVTQSISKLTSAALVGEAKKKARHAQCRVLIDAGKVTRDDCPDGREENAP